MVDSLIRDCVILAELVSPVVCNSSPEGFLPSEDVEETVLLSVKTEARTKETLDQQAQWIHMDVLMKQNFFILYTSFCGFCVLTGRYPSNVKPMCFFFQHTGSESLATAPEDVSGCTGNAQSLLLCCWHCMKEVMLLLGLIVQTYTHYSGRQGCSLSLNHEQVSL